MSCCGQKRALQRAESDRARAQTTVSSYFSTPERSQPAEKWGIILHYRGKGTLSLLGPQTGTVYYFDEKGDGTVIDEKDLNALLLTHLFEQNQTGEILRKID